MVSHLSITQKLVSLFNARKEKKNRRVRRGSSAMKIEPLELRELLAADLFISEYIEGTSNNKALEIFNDTGAPVDLATGQYAVQMYFNGSSSAGLTINLSGTVAQGDVFVVAQSSANATILAQADRTNSAGWFNGDDAVVLTKNGTILDVIGKIGSDPGSEWGTGLQSTQDNTLRRKAGTSGGDVNGTDAFDPTVQWDGFATDTFDGLGSHAGGDELTPSVTITATDGNAAEAGTDPGTFRISRTKSTTSDLIVNYSVATGAGQAINGSDYTPSLTGTVIIGAGQSFADVIITPVEDSDIEGTETAKLTLVDTADYDLGGTITATVTIVDNDAAPTRIRDIQGAGHLSPLLGQVVHGVSGIVTAIATNGLYFQDTNPDSDDATSEGIFVFTSSAPTAAVGDSIIVNGTVAEFRPGNNLNSLTTTEIVSPSISVMSSGNAMPAAIVLGIGGRLIPTSVIDNDGFIFDPAEDGIDFYESMEGMRVQINNPVSTSPTAVFGTSEEIWVLADNGSNASSRTVRGGSLITSADFNPERIQIDDLINASVSLPAVDVGAQLSTISGVVSYDFNNYEVLVATSPTVVQTSTLQKEVTNLTGNATQLTVANFNLENLDPGDGAAKFNNLANAIVNNLKSPDIINLEEIQDNNGAINDGVVDASVTLQTLIDAIAAAGGPTYQYRQINPLDETNGDQPGGNIRVAFLFNPNRVSFVDRSGGTSTSSTTVTDVGSNGTPDLSASPGLIDPTNSAFVASRKPIVGEFLFNGQTVFVIGNHFNSKGGDQPLFGANQPPTLTSEAQRNQQAAIVKTFVQSILSINPNANIVVAGDLNDFEFSSPLTILESGGLHTLVETLPANERYTYNFQGNAQVLDHLMVSNSLRNRLNGYDVVHINSEFADQISDHDPVVARFNLGYTLQFLHYYGESGLLGVETAPIMGALIDKFDDQYSNTLKLGEGDTFIPGPWLIGGADPSLNSVPGIGSTALGRPDIAILNAFGTDASALGNHEFDLGSPVLQGALAGSGAWVGAQFPFITANLNFSADSSLRGLADATIGGTASNAFAGKEASNIKGKIAPYTVITEGGEKIGIVGATTYELLTKSSPNGTVPRDDGNPSTDDLQEVAAYIQAAVNALTSLGVNKIVLVDQLDTLSRNQLLAPMVYGVDVMIAGGGHERMGDSTDTAASFNGHDANFVATYPIVTAGSDSKPTLIVTTDTEFTYLGRLVVEFDANGEIVLGSLDESINGAYASTEAALQAAYETTANAATIVASSTIGTQVNTIVQAINNVIVAKDSNVFGYTDVYLEGDRVFGRAQEVNLGDISADANLYKAREALSPGVILASLKNGGGIRASIGSVGEDGEKLPPAASSVKPAGAISQLDVENALRFNNRLMVFDTNPQDLLDILNYAAGLTPGNGGYAQIGGVRFSYIPSRPAGQKVVDVAIYDLDDNLVARVVDNGVILPGAPATISVAVLNFTANGGDGYPIKANGENFRFLLNDGTLSAAIDETLDFNAAVNFPANALGEQEAFQDFLGEFHGTVGTAYDVADTRAALDQRIQNLSSKADTVFPGVDLSNYVRIGRYDLPEPTRTTPPANSLLAQEVSAVTYNWDTDTLFVVGDGGTSVVQVSKTGQLINSMTLAPGSSAQGTDFYDPEGLTYVGNGMFVMAEERDRQAVLFTYAAGTTLSRSGAQTVKLGTTIGNIGIEGITYDPLTGGFIAVKEALPQGIFETGIDFAAGTATNGSPTTVNSTNIFDPALAGLLDFADVFSLSNLPYLSGEADFNHILALSQESGKIVELDRSGNIVSSLTIISDPGNPLTVPNQQHEGLTMDSSGYLYVVSENGGGDFDHPQLWVYAPATTPNQAPTALLLNNQVTAIVENTNTTTRFKVADIAVTDDGQGTNVLTVTGPDASFFEVDNNGLYIKAGTLLDFETKTTYSVTVNVDDPTVGSNPDASASYSLSVTDLVDETPIGLFITEVAPWSSGNSPANADWFELTNTGSSVITITGWKIDDNSNSFASSRALNGITSIAPGESVIFLESSTSNPPEMVISAFKSVWFGGSAPANLQFGTYQGSGVGLSTGGDAVNIYDAGGVLKANVSFGASPAPEVLPTFNNAALLNNTTISTLSVVGTNNAFSVLDSTGNTEIGSPGTIGRLFISEVAPWSSGNSPLAADWFEVTNSTAFAADITGWKIDDNSGSFAAAVALNGISRIAPGESVIFIESSAPATIVPAFKSLWFGASSPTGLSIGTYSGSGVGLSTGGDAVNLYNGTGVLRASVSFAASPAGPAFPTFDNTAGLNNVAISKLSAVGVNSAIMAVNDTKEIGSPGTITNYAPVFTSGTSFSVAEANTNGVTGPSSSATPYLTSTNSNVQFTSIMTVGDAVNGYRMVGIPDGMGAFDNGDGTLTLLMNHELGGSITSGVANPVGAIRAHGSPGAFVSRWVINKSTLEVLSIQDFLANGTSVYLSNNNPSAGAAHTDYLAAATTVISRLCSADLAPVSAYQWYDEMGTMYGTAARIFQSGEESGGIATSTSRGNLGPEGTVHFGRQFAFVATDDPNTVLNEAGTAWELPHAGLFAWENNLANPLPQRKTIVMGMDDGSPIGQVYMWVGDKQTTGNVVERAGLTKKGANDNMYVLRVPSLATVDGSGVPIETLGSPVSGEFTMVNEGDVSGLTFAGLEALSDSHGATQFLRPEDGQWDPDNPSDFYFVTTSNYDQTKDGVGSGIGRSRLYKLSFTDITQPELGGTITALLDGTEAGNMFDNMTVSNGKVILQEDPGNQQHLAKVWEYDIATDTLTELAQHDRARFGDVGVPALAPFTLDEENSGVIDVSEMLGAGTYLLNVQSHFNIGDPELVEGGQLLFMRTNVTSGEQFVTTVTATDANSSRLTYTISGGDDAADFTIDPATGRLSFAVAPNFEAPTDDNGNNEYVVEVSVSDGVGPAVTQIITVTVTNVNESPTNSTVETVSVAENTFAVTTATGVDPEGVALTFAISGGADSGKFKIDQNTGALSFLAAPNFEAPTDIGANNSYFVTVTVSDGVNPPVNKTVKVTVTNATELGGIDVQNGQTQRSYLRTLDLLFDQSSGLMDLIDNNRLQLTQFDLNGQNGVLKSFLKPTVVGNKINFDFGAQGIGGNRNTNAGDGYYELAVDMDGNGSFETKKSFYRLLGDVNGDKKVDSTDRNLTLSAFGTTNPERDVNGDGFVNANDRTLILRALGRKLKDDLFLND